MNKALIRRKNGAVAAVTLATLLLSPALPTATARAASARAQFGITLVIAPACPLTEQGTPTAGIAGTRAQALDIAAAQLGVPATRLLVRHDHRATGWWIVSDNPAPGAEPLPLLRIEKCSGTVVPAGDPADPDQAS